MSDDTSTQAVEELIGELPEGVEVPPEVAALFSGKGGAVNSSTEPDVGPSLVTCVICGEYVATASTTGRCKKCKHKRMPNNTSRISAARAKLGTVTHPDEIEAKNAEIAALRVALNNAQPLTLSDFKERVQIMRNAGVESYEDRGVRIVMKADISSKRTAGVPLIE